MTKTTVRRSVRSISDAREAAMEELLNLGIIKPLADCALELALRGCALCMMAKCRRPNIHRTQIRTQLAAIPDEERLCVECGSALSDQRLLNRDNVCHRCDDGDSDSDADTLCTGCDEPVETDRLASGMMLCERCHKGIN